MARIHEAIVEVMRHVGAIGKNSTNQSQNYKYRSADDVYNAVAPLMAEYGICSVPKVLETSHETGTSRGGGAIHYTRLLVQYTFFAGDGSSVECVVASEGMDSGDKATPKALTVAHRYAICQLFVIPVADVTIDSERDSHEYQPPKKQTQKPPASTPVATTPELSDEVKAMIDDYTAMIDAAVTTESLEKIGKTLADKPEAVRHALATPYRKRLTTLKEPKPVATITAADAEYIADAMREIDMAKNPKELEAIGFNFANKSPAVRHALAKTYTDKLTNFAKEETEDAN